MKKPKSRLPIILGALFALALLMGPGPGLYLVNPDAADPDARRTFLGLPVIYAWGLLWFGVQLGVIVAAYLTVWTADDEEP